MSGSPIYFSRSWCPSHLLIRVSRGHISQKYSPLYSGLFCRENYFEKRYLLMLFILPELLSVMNCSFLLLMLLLSQHIAGSPVSPCNLSCGACIFFPSRLLLLSLSLVALLRCSSTHNILCLQQVWPCSTYAHVHTGLVWLQLKCAQCFRPNPYQICCFHTCCAHERKISRAAGAMPKKGFSNWINSDHILKKMQSLCLGCFQ